MDIWVYDGSLEMLYLFGDDEDTAARWASVDFEGLIYFQAELVTV
jgi:hypothetical protein